MKNFNYKLLLIDTDVDLLENTKLILTSENISVLIATNSREAIQLAKNEKPALIMLEILMPELDGIDICIELRKIEELKNTLIVFFTQRFEDYSQIAAFNAGADDYIIKPAKPRVLISRLKALLKRHFDFVNPQRENKFSKGIIIDRERYLIFRDGEEIILPRKEFELLALMFASPRKVFTRKEISDLIWGYEFILKNRTIDVHIRKLRQKIGDNYIKTIKGVGYSLEV